MKLDFLSLLQATSEVWGCTAAGLRNRGRKGPLAFARQVAMTIAYDHGLSSSVVGRWFLRDRSTVIHAIRTVRHVSRDHNDPRVAKIAATIAAYKRIAAQNVTHQE
jgi:chromosomal replication initiation ATPase DnaA